MIALALSFFGFATIGCAILALDKSPSWSRMAVIMVAPALAFAVWQAAQPPSGWPAHTKPPKSAQFLSGIVREPTQKSPGEIDLWLIPPNGVRPRAYRLQYSRRLHEQVVEAIRRSSKGEQVAVRMVGKRKGHRGPKVRYVFYRFLPPALPAKH